MEGPAILAILLLKGGRKLEISGQRVGHVFSRSAEGRVGGRAVMGAIYSHPGTWH